jgi:hypothetical protein
MCSIGSRKFENEMDEVSVTGSLRSFYFLSVPSFMLSLSLSLSPFLNHTSAFQKRKRSIGEICGECLLDESELRVLQKKFKHLLLLVLKTVAGGLGVLHPAPSIPLGTSG